MKITKCKLLLALLTACLALTLLASCTGEDGEESTGTTTPAAETTLETTAEETTEPVVGKAYIFTVICGDTMEPVAGARVQLCKGESFCMMPVATGSDGVANYVLAGGNDYDVYDVHIIGGVPEGYTFDNGAVRTDATTHAYTLTLTREGAEETTTEGTCTHVFVNGVCTKCGETETFRYTVKVVYDDEYDGHAAGEPISGVSLVITTNDPNKIVANGVTAEQGEFSFMAPEYLEKDNGMVVGGYYVRVVGGIPEGMGGDAVCVFQDRARTVTVGLYPVVVKTGNRTPWDPQFIAIGETVHGTIEAAREDDALTSTDDSYFYYAFRPQSLADAGMYRVTVKNFPGEYTMKIGHFIANAAFIWSTPDEVGIGNDEPNVEFALEETYMLDYEGKFIDTNFWLLGVKVVGDATYPVSFDIVVEKVRDLVPGVDFPKEERHEMTLPEGAPDADSIIGSTSGLTLKTIDPEKETVTLVKDENGYYHINAVDGAFAMVTITSHNELIVGSEEHISFANVDEFSGTDQVTLGEIVTEDGITTIHYYMYHDLLVEYGRLCNADGAYVLNDQLLDFLRGYAAQRQGLTGENDFLLGVSYYK